METYALDDVRQKYRDSIRGVRNDNKLYHKTLDETAVHNLTLNYSLSKMTINLLGKSRIVNPPTVTTAFALQKSGKNYARLDTQPTFMNIPPPLLSAFVKLHSDPYQSRRSRSSLIHKPEISAVAP